MSEMVEVKTSELEGAALDWAVAKSCFEVWFNTDGEFGQATGWLVKKRMSVDCVNYRVRDFNPSTNWAHGGPLIERHQIELTWNGESGAVKYWCAYYMGSAEYQKGDTLLKAAMRAIVTSVLGDTVEVPKELVT